MNIEGLTFETVSDLKDYGRTDDGTPFIGEVFWVQATDAKGNRLDHNMRFDGVKREVDCETGNIAFIDMRPVAKFQCGRIINKIRRRNFINLANWTEGRPVYGSETYIAYGQQNDLEQERRELDDEQ